MGNYWYTNIGGRTLALAIHPENPDILFVVSASGGVVGKYHWW